jgi:hypothetical protein
LKERVFDPKGLEAGVRAASEPRVEQLGEEHQWIKLALASLADLRIPCDANDFRQRWDQAGTMDQVRRERDNRVWYEVRFQAGRLARVRMSADRVV